MARALLTAFALFWMAVAGAQADPPAGATPVFERWAIAEFGEPLYTAQMAHWPYARPDAPKGGSVVLGAFGSFDSLNTYILRGNWPAGIGIISDSLMVGSGDELVSAYGQIAASVEYPADRSWIIFNLRPEARWHDGVPITADDFLFSFNTIKEIGRPFLKAFYVDAEKAEVLSPHRIKFTVRTRDTMKPLVTLGGLSPLPRHFWATRDITQTTLEPILGSGPYKIAAIDPGRSITYERVKDYWGDGLAINRGVNNFDQIRYDYYRDETVMFEAFLAGRIDFRSENRAQRWVTGYETPEVKSGRIVRKTVPNNAPRGNYGLAINLRRPQFQDIRVRQALNLLFDFETLQRTTLYGQYRRIASWFPNSEYGSGGPPKADELAILEKYRDRLAPEVLTAAFEPSKTDGSGNIRPQLRAALKLLEEAGWTLQGNRLANQAGQPFALEILLYDTSLVRVTQPYVETLRKAGIDAKLRVVDTAQYEVRTDEYDFDMVILALTFYPPPGPELASYFHSSVVDVKGQGNFSAIKDPVVDALLEEIAAARTLSAVEATTRALDRVLLWGYYIVPFWYDDVSWIAYWDKFGSPATLAKYSIGFPFTWWVEPGRSGPQPPPQP